MSDIVFGEDGSGGEGDQADPVRSARRTRRRPAEEPAPARRKRDRPAPAPAAPVAEAAAPQASLPGDETGRDDMSRLFGQVVSLLGQSPAHRHLFVSDLEWLVLPALTARQARIWRRQTERGTVPVAYVSWAMVNGEVEERLLRGQVRLKPTEWRCGDRPWLIDVVAPYGGAEAAIAELAEKVFPGQTLRALVPSTTGGVSVRTIKGGKSAR